MAGNIGTNVTTDGSSEMNLLKSILSEIEKWIDSREMTEKAQLNKKMAEYLLQDKVPICASVPGKNAKDLENLIIAQEMPYISFKNEASGEYLFIVREEDKEKFEQLQREAFSKDGSLFRSQTEKNMLEVGLHGKEKEVIKLTVKNRAEMSMLQAKLANQNIVYGVCEIDGEQSIVISPDDLARLNGKDLISFEMEWAMTQTYAGKTFGFGENENGMNLNKLRKAQGAFDEDQIKTLLDKEDCVLTDVKGNSNYYIEKNKEVITVYKKDEKGEWQQEAQLDGKDGREAFVRNYAAKITDMYAYEGEELQDGYDHTKMSKPEAQATIPDDFKRPTTAQLSPKDRAIKEICDHRFQGEGGLLSVIQKKAINNVKDRYSENAIKSMTKVQLHDLIKAETSRLLDPANAKETPEYQAFLEENGTYNVLTNAMLVTEGYDEPSVDCIVCLRPTQSESLYQQIVGRGTRLCEGKKDLLLLDFLWLTGKHKLCKPADLFASDEEIAKKMCGLIDESKDPLDLMDLEEDVITEINRDREEALARQLDALKRQKAQYISSLQFFASLEQLDDLFAAPIYAWEREKPTTKQLLAIEKFGLDSSKVETKGIAAKILDICFQRKEDGLSTVKQIKLLERYGFVHVGKWTFEEANAMIDRLAKNHWKVPFNIRVSTYKPMRLKENN